jgi:hypothetical protein
MPFVQFKRAICCPDEPKNDGATVLVRGKQTTGQREVPVIIQRQAAVGRLHCHPCQCNNIG